MRFNYYKAENLKSAIEMLDQAGETGKVIAGGTDYLIGLSNGKYSPNIAIDITSIENFGDFEFKNGRGVTIGATVTMGDVCRSAERFNIKYPSLVEACSQLGSPQIRNLATIGGNICNAAPSAETAPALLALGSKVIIAGPKGNREIELDNFFKGPSLTILEKNEIMVQIEIGDPPDNSGNAYLRLSPRNALDIAIVNVGTFVKLSSNLEFEDVRIFLGAVAPTPARAVSAEKVLIGEIYTEDLIKQAGVNAKMDAVPITDVRASASYRKEMVAVLTERTLKMAYDRAKINMNFST